MSKSTVRKEVVHTGPVDQTPAGSSATDEFERFFAEQFRPAPARASVMAVAAPVAAPSHVEMPVAIPAAPGVQQASPDFDDPLMAELARIVGQQGVQRAMARAGEAEPVAQASTRTMDPLAAFEEELRRFDEMHRQAAAQPAAPADLGQTQSALPPDHMAALEDELRRFDPHAEPELRGMAQDQAAAARGPEGLENEYQQPVPVFAEEEAPVAARPRSRRVVALLGSAAAVALVGVIGAVAMKSGKTPTGGQVPVIAANTQPMKEKPSDPGGVEITGQDRQVLAKGAVEASKPATMVNKEEQPVDLNQTPKREVSRVILPATNSSAQVPQQVAAVPQAAPIIMPPPAPPAAATAAPPPAPTQAGGFEAKRVRSVKVGPEGDPVAGAQPVPAAPPAAVATQPRPAVAAPATPPKAETRTAAVTPKSDARPTTAVRAQTTTPQPLRQAAKAAAPATAAAAPPAAAGNDDDEDVADNKPMSLRPPAGASPTRAVAKAAATTPQTTASTGGGFAVQLAAAGSEAEARSSAASMKQKYSALSGYSPSWRTSAVNGRTVYRVRVSNLSREKANDLCGKIKAGGGSCFVAGN